jgi:ankyrin repeat protein
MNFCAIFIIMVVALAAPSLTANAADRCVEFQVLAQDNEVDRMQEFLNQGVDVDCKDPLTSETALMRAASSGRVEAVKLLLSRGAKVNLRTKSGETALSRVVLVNMKLSKAGEQFTPLLQRQREVIRILKEAGAVE